MQTMNRLVVLALAFIAFINPNTSNANVERISAPHHTLDMNPNDGVCTSHDWSEEVVICTGSNGDWSCVEEGSAWACGSDDAFWTTDCPTCGKMPHTLDRLGVHGVVEGGNCRWGDTAGTDYDCAIECGSKWIATCIYFASFDATICGSSGGGVTLEGNICPGEGW